MKKPMSVSVIALLFVSMLSPIVRADMTLTSEFVESVENWGFEGRDMSPGGGVYGSPPWETNNGGWRELRGDINRDGIVNDLDQDILAAASGSTPGDPNWNPDADLNGDGIVNGHDLYLLSIDFGEEANRIHGSYSWYTGGGDYLMWQDVSNDVISAIAGQTVMFGFWFYPQSVSSDGSQNNARAEIYYEYTTPPPPPPPGDGGGGCPYVSTWDGTRYLLDNNLLPASETSDGVDVEDYYKLQQTLVKQNGKYSLMISEFENEHSYFDQVQLQAVDHESDVNIAVSPYGEILTYKGPGPPITATNRNGEDITHLLTTMDRNYYEGYAGDYLILDFGEFNLEEYQKLVMRADARDEKWSIHVQILNETGSWETVAAVIPRVHWATEIVNLSDYLPDPNGELKVRLYFTANHKLDYVGLDTSRQDDFNLHYANLVSAIHSKDGDVKSNLKFADGLYAELLPGKQIELAFTLPEKEDDQTRDFILFCKGHYYTLPEGTVIDPTVYGVWVAPTELKWYNAYVTVSLPSTTTAVKVFIHGTPDFRAWIDLTSLSITTTASIDCISSQGDDWGDLSLSANIFRYETVGGPYFDGRVIMSVALYAESDRPDVFVYIYATELKVEFLPTVQDSQLHIEKAWQANDLGKDIDPAEEEELSNNAITAAQTAINVVAPAVTILLMPPTAPLWAQFLVAYAPLGTTLILDQLRTNPYQPDARPMVDPNNYAVWERWQYASKLIPTQYVPSSVTGHYDLSWIFHTASANEFKVRVSATVWFYYWYEGICYTPSWSVSTDITINP